MPSCLDNTDDTFDFMIPKITVFGNVAFDRWWTNLHIKTFQKGFPFIFLFRWIPESSEIEK